MASAAVCSSMFSSWHNVSKLRRTELSSILPDSESDDSSPRIYTQTVGYSLHQNRHPAGESYRHRNTELVRTRNTNNNSSTRITLPPTLPSVLCVWRENFGRPTNQTQGTRRWTRVPIRSGSSAHVVPFCPPSQIWSLSRFGSHSYMFWMKNYNILHIL